MDVNLKSLEKYIDKHKERICNEWFNAIVGSYPEESAKYLLKSGKQFGNPVGHTASSEVHAFIDALFKDDPKSLALKLENFIRIRAVQEIPPDESLKFLYVIKNIIDTDISKSGEKFSNKEVHRLYSKIDECALHCFSIYLDDRLKLAEMRAGQTNKIFGRMVERLNQKYESMNKKNGGLQK